MKKLPLALTLMTAISCFSTFAMAQEAVVDVSLRPAGSFKGKTNEVKGFATMKGDKVEATNVSVNLKSLKTGISLRDDHTKKHLEADKYPEAVLVSATGQGGKGEGLIRIRGIEKKIAGTYKIEGSTLKADFPIKFSEFNIKNIKYMGVGVDDEGVIHIALPVKK